jgi:hypothetical protein
MMPETVPESPLPPFLFVGYIYINMKYLITESQHKRLLEEEQKVLHIPDIKVFGDDWDVLQKFLESKGNPPYSLGGDLYLFDNTIESLGNLTSVGGDLDLRDTPIESLGDLQTVGGNLYLENTPISKKYTKKKIRQMVNVSGNIYL